MKELSGLFAAVISTFLSAVCLPFGIADAHGLPQEFDASVFVYVSHTYSSTEDSAVSSDREPPGEHNLTSHRAADRWSAVVTARRRLDTSLTTYTYDDAARLAQVAQGMATKKWRVRATDPPLVVFHRPSVAAKTGDELLEGKQYVYRVHGGESGPWGHSWTPENPMGMANPRSELGLPKVNSGQMLTRAKVRSMDGVIKRDALPLDGNPGGAPEWLFPNPTGQLEHHWTIPLVPPW